MREFTQKQVGRPALKLLRVDSHQATFFDTRGMKVRPVRRPFWLRLSWTSLFVLLSMVAIAVWMVAQ